MIRIINFYSKFLAGRTKFTVRATVFLCIYLKPNIMVVDLSLEVIRETDIEHFCVEIMKRLDIQRRNEQFCDVILEVGFGDDQARLKAHRIVLCVASPFFYNALNSDMKEKKEGVIRLEETSKAAMEDVLEYLYTGGIFISLTPSPWTTTMDYRNGLPKWTAKWTTHMDYQNVQLSFYFRQA